MRIFISNFYVVSTYLSVSEETGLEEHTALFTKIILVKTQ